MAAGRTNALSALAFAVALGACGGDDDGGFLTSPGSPVAGGASRDADCIGDGNAPVVRSVRALPEMLWPPNHEMVTVTVHGDAIDDCDPLAISVVDVWSDEPLNGTGDGDTAPDWHIDGPLALKLRAERAGTGDGRVYTIRVRFADGAGNERFEHVYVTVPHDDGENP